MNLLRWELKTEEQSEGEKWPPSAETEESCKRISSVREGTEAKRVQIEI